MDLTRPFEVVTPTLDGVVLQVLAGRKPNDPPSVFEIGHDAGVGSVSGLRKVLRRLVAQGIVTELPQGEGLATVFRLNRSHLAYEAVVGLARQSDELRERLAAEAARVRGLVHAEVAGHPDPELVLVVEPEVSGRVFWRMDVEHLQEQVRLWTGLTVPARTVTPQEWERERSDEHGVQPGPRVRPESHAAHSRA